MRPSAPRDRPPLRRHGRRHGAEHGAPDRSRTCCPDAPLRFKFEPPGYQLHLWREDSGLVTHTAVFGDWPGPYPLRAEPRAFLIAGQSALATAASGMAAAARRSHLVVEVAGDDPPAEIAQFRLLLGAPRHRLRTARVEAAAGRRVERARHFAGQDDLLAALVGMARQRRREQRLRYRDASARSASARASPVSTILPRYMTAIVWLICATAARSWAMNR